MNKKIGQTLAILATLLLGACGSTESGPLEKDPAPTAPQTVYGACTSDSQCPGGTCQQGVCVVEKIITVPAEPVCGIRYSKLDLAPVPSRSEPVQPTLCFRAEPSVISPNCQPVATNFAFIFRVKSERLDKVNVIPGATVDGQSVAFPLLNGGSLGPSGWYYVRHEIAGVRDIGNGLTICAQCTNCATPDDQPKLGVYMESRLEGVTWAKTPTSATEKNYSLDLPVALGIF